MNTDQQRYMKKAITSYGVRISQNVLWFVDEGIVHFGLEHNGEIVHYLSGFISGETFVAVYSTQNENLDITGWNTFISSHLDLELVDAR